MNTEPAAPTSTPRLRASAAGAVLVVLVLAVYLPSLGGGFVWDDWLLVQQNPLNTGELSLRSIWFSTDFPLALVTLRAEWLAFGNHAAGYRIVNALLHAASCLLLWRVLARLRIPGAGLAAAFFAVHPVGVASVGWISEIKNTLSLPFYLASCWFFLAADESDEAGDARRSRRNSRWSWLMFFLALTAKTSTVMLPVVLLGGAWWRRGRIGKNDLWKTAPHFALALAFGLLTVWFQTRQALAGFTLPPESFASRLAGAGMAVWFYLGKALLPLQLSAIYPRWEIDAHQALAYVPLLLLVGLAAASWWFRRTWGRHALFALGCFAVSLFPALGFFDMYFLVFARVSDHFQYVALIAPLALVAAILNSVGWKIIPRVVGVALVAGLGLLAAQRARVYATDEALWRDTLAKNPAAWNAHNNLGCILAEQNDLPGATAHFITSLKLNPRNVSAHCNFGRALLLKNNFPEAEAHFRTALELKPDHGDTLRAYGAALADQGRKVEAVKLLRQARQLKPDPSTRLQLAQLLSGLGRDAEAVAELRAVLTPQSDAIPAMQNLAWILATSPDEKVRNGSEAVALAERAWGLSADKSPQLFAALAAAYAEAGRFDEAVTTAQKAVNAAQARGNESFAQANAQLQELYRTGKPYHSPPPNAPGR